MTGTLTPERIERVAKYLWATFGIDFPDWDKAPERDKLLWRDQAISVLCEAMIT